MYAKADLRAVSREGLVAIIVEQEAAIADLQRRLREFEAGLAEMVTALGPPAHPSFTPRSAPRTR